MSNEAQGATQAHAPDAYSVDDYDVLTRQPEDLNVGQLNRAVRSLREKLHEAAVQRSELLVALKDVALIMRAHPDVFEEFAGEPWTGRVASAIAKAEGR